MADLLEVMIDMDMRLAVVRLARAEKLLPNPAPIMRSIAGRSSSGSRKAGEALFKRLLIAAQACALAWRPMRAQGEAAEHTRAFLVRLAGRQMKRATPVTASALLAGL